MKSFHEMFRDKIDRVDNSVVLFEGEYKQIQLDAYKAGMAEAAEIVNPKGTRIASKEIINAKHAILTARDNKTPAL